MSFLRINHSSPLPFEDRLVLKRLSEQKASIASITAASNDVPTVPTTRTTFSRTESRSTRSQTRSQSIPSKTPSQPQRTKPQRSESSPRLHHVIKKPTTTQTISPLSLINFDTTSFPTEQRNVRPTVQRFQVEQQYLAKIPPRQTASLNINNLFSDLESGGGSSRSGTPLAQTPVFTPTPTKSFEIPSLSSKFARLSPNRVRFGEDEDYYEEESVISDQNSSSIGTTDGPLLLPEVSELTHSLVDAIDEINKDSRSSLATKTPDVVTKTLNKLIRSDSKVSEFTTTKSSNNVSVNTNTYLYNPNIPVRELYSREKARLSLLKFVTEKEIEEKNKLAAEKLRKELASSQLRVLKWKEKKELQNDNIRKEVMQSKELIKIRNEEQDLINAAKVSKRRKENSESKEKTKIVEEQSKEFVTYNNMLAKQLLTKYKQKQQDKIVQDKYNKVTEKRNREISAKIQTGALTLYEIDEMRHINRKKKEITQRQLENVKQAEYEKAQTKVLKVKVDKYMGDLEKQKREEEERVAREHRRIARQKLRELEKLQRSQTKYGTAQPSRPVFTDIRSGRTYVREEILSRASEYSYFDVDDYTDSENDDQPVVVVAKSTSVPKGTLGNINIDLSHLNSNNIDPYDPLDSARSSLSARMSAGTFSPQNFKVATNFIPYSPRSQTFSTISSNNSSLLAEKTRLSPNKANNVQIQIPFTTIPIDNYL